MEAAETTTTAEPGILSSHSSYEDALRERLQRIQMELEAQAAVALTTRRSVESTRKEAEANAQQLARLREQWVAEQPQREALLKETGEKERRLAERERRLAEQLAAQAAGDMPSRSSRAASSSNANTTVGTVTEKSSVLQEHRQRLAAMEGQRQKLTAALKELREATRQETAEVVQLKDRTEVLRKESKSLRAGAEAARENETRVRSKLEGLDVTAAAAQQRHHTLERHIADLHEEVQRLRDELAVSTAAAPVAAENAPVAMRHSPEETWAMNRKLEAKVKALREELKGKQEVVQRLRLASRTQVNVNADDRAEERHGSVQEEALAELEVGPDVQFQMVN